VLDILILTLKRPRNTTVIWVRLDKTRKGTIEQKEVPFNIRIFNLIQEAWTLQKVSAK
jgi:hypothetical protein